MPETPLAQDGSDRPPLKDIDNALDEIDELLERWNNRLSFNNLSLVERYIKGELWIVLDARVWSAGDIHAVDYRAIFQGNATTGIHYQRRRWNTVENEAVRRADVDGRARYDGFVSVKPGKLVESPESLIASFVWLQSPDELVGPCADALYFSRSVGFKFFSRPRYGKSGAAGQLAPIRDHEGADHLVERSSKVANRITDDGAKVSGDLFVHFDPTDWVSTLRIYLSDDAVGVTCVKRANFRTQLADVAFGPFNLYPNAAEAVLRHSFS